MYTPHIEVVQNYLHVDGEILQVEETTPEELERVLKIGRETILRGIESFYENMIAKNPGATVQHPSINLMTLGKDTDESPILSDYGRLHATGLSRNEAEISERVRPYWRAIAEAAFIPEVRLWVKDTYGLLLRDEPLR